MSASQTRTSLEHNHQFSSANDGENSYDDTFVLPDFSDLHFVDQRLHMGIEHGQRVHFSLDDGRSAWGTVVDMHRNSEDSAYKVLLSDGRTIWITAASIDQLGGFDKKTDVVPFLSSVMNLPIVVNSYINFWYDTPVWMNGELEAIAVDIEGDSVICWVDGWKRYTRFNLKDVQLDELALKSELGNEYENWLDDLEQAYAIA